MSSSLGWSWPRGAALRYCVKVAVAALLGYVLSIGGMQYALYGAFTAALVVGASRGEDVGSAWNRARGSMAGMVVGMAASHLAPHPAIGVGIGLGLTAYICMGCGWGQAAARIGASLCAVMILAHSQDAIEYSVMRVGDTAIGIAAGLLVSYTVLPIRGHDALAANIERCMKAVAGLLELLSQPARPPDRSAYFAVFDSMVALQKTLADAKHEIGGDFETLRERGRLTALVCVGALSAALAQAELCETPGGLAAADSIRQQSASLAKRAGTNGADPGHAAAPVGADAAETIDREALQAFALGLRKVEHGLRQLGR